MQQWQIGKSVPTKGELEGLLRSYPWFSIAQKELYLMLLSEGKGYSSNVTKRFAPYLSATEELVKNAKKEICKRGDVVTEVIPQVEEKPAVIKVEEANGREVFVVGGDYFGKDDYQAVKGSGTDIFEAFKESVASETRTIVRIDKSDDQFSDDEYCTETLAKIYVSQGCFKRALEVYDKLILLYPEKSTYFAALKEEIKKQL